MINLDKYEAIGSYWIASYMNNDNVGASNDAAYFDSFRGEHIPK